MKEELRKEIEGIITKIEKLQSKFIFTDPIYAWLAEAKFYLQKVLEVL